MVTVNEHLPESHRDHITDFGDVRDEAHVPPGNSSEGPAPTQEELLEANEAAAAAAMTAPESAPEEAKEEEDLWYKPHQGASSWYSDPDAVSSDVTQANVPGYEEEGEAEAGEEAAESEGESESELFDPTTHTISQVESYVAEYPGELARVLQAEHDSNSPRSSLITKLENMGV